MQPVSVLVRLTDSTSKLPLYVDAACVRIIGKSKQNPMITVVETYQVTAFEINESVEEAAQLVNAGRQGYVIEPVKTSDLLKMG